jgi:pSer/pThr/pTyr-binding forkhead associated (FHA) protein
MILRLVSVDPSIVNAPGYLVIGNTYVVGRSKSCHFMVSDHSVSRSHAQVTAQEDSVLIKDLGSTNGTTVDGNRIDEATVKPGQTIRVGRVHFVLTSDDHSAILAEDYSAFSTDHALANNATNELPALKLLSEGQRRVLDVLLTGLQEKEVANQLHLSPHTVHNHVKEIYKKLQVNSRSELLALFVGEGKPPKKPEK